MEYTPPSYTPTATGHLGQSFDGSWWIASGGEWVKLADGSAIPQTSFPELYAVVQDTFGEAPEGEFRLPDLRGHILSPPGLKPWPTS